MIMGCISLIRRWCWIVGSGLDDKLFSEMMMMVVVFAVIMLVVVMMMMMINCMIRVETLENTSCRYITYFIHLLFN